MREQNVQRKQSNKGSRRETSDKTVTVLRAERARLGDTLCQESRLESVKMLFKYIIYLSNVSIKLFMLVIDYNRFHVN